MTSVALGLSVALAIPALAIPVFAQPRMEIVRANDNRARAGILSGSTLAIRMEARLAEWHPQGVGSAGAVIPVFAEIGRPAQVPGPLIRVPGGTNIIAVVRNAVPNTILTIHGLHSRPSVGAAFNDSIQLPYGGVQTLRFRLDRPGTYYYWGTTTGAGFGARTHEDAQLTGAIVVDDPEMRTPHDRIFVLGMWADTAFSETNRHRRRELSVMNGRAWPTTDRLQYEKGETVLWRVINASADAHPMHLHGFYYRVRRRGDGRADTVLGRPEMEHTDLIPAGGTVSLSWVADRLGTWLFHCAEPAHSSLRGPLGYPWQHEATQAGAEAADGTPDDLGGMVNVVEIIPSEDDTTAALPLAPEPTRHLRLVIRPNAGSTPSAPYYSIAIDSTGLEPEVPVGQRIGPPLMLTRGETVSLTIVNGLSEPTSINWHGLETESVYDGVPGISGTATERAPQIAPSDSFEVRLTPQRAGTFIYHSHLNEERQLRAGVLGALLVVDRGKWNPARDIPVVISSPSDPAEEDRAVLVNGSLHPDPVLMAHGVTYRLRLINITTARPNLRFELAQDSFPVSWRPVAKDGADLPASARVTRSARQGLSIGETMDVEFTPARAGEYRLNVLTSAGTLLGFAAVQVR